MARPRSSKASQKAADDDSITVAIDTPPSPPATRRKAYATTVEADAPKKTRGHRRSKSKSEYSQDGDGVGSDDDNKLIAAAANRAGRTRAKAAKTSSVASREVDRSLRKAKKVVSELSDTFEETRSWPLPGSLSYVSEGDLGELGRMAMWSIASLIVSAAARSLFGMLSTGWSQTWVTFPSHAYTADLSSIGSVLAMFASRMLRMTLSNGYLALPNLIALNVLYYGPIIFLLSTYYDVPLTATLFSEGIDFASDLVPLFLHRYVLRRTKEPLPEDEGDKNDGFLLYDNSISFDPVSYVYSSVLAAVLYAFTFVQACRLFLPKTLVVHFYGIATVEPARVYSLSPSTMPKLHELFSAVFQSVPTVLLNLACGTAARTFIFNHQYGLSDASPGFSHSAAFFRRVVALRTATLSLSVGLSIFLHCYYNIPGVDAVGAAAFASIWAVAPLLVGVGLASTGL
ncbi:hypothetical protein SEPCBS119000_001813 [Sporothrix epigloea]|uniref:Uncharacterized protein n=1 Tax=Sporothrix epigloea TaxID=1892477 RepID=A0ABP0DEB3_9PEZI